MRRLIAYFAVTLIVLVMIVLGGLAPLKLSSDVASEELGKPELTQIFESRCRPAH